MRSKRDTGPEVSTLRCRLITKRSFSFYVQFRYTPRLSLGANACFFVMLMSYRHVIHVPPRATHVLRKTSRIDNITLPIATTLQNLFNAIHLVLATQNTVTQELSGIKASLRASWQGHGHQVLRYIKFHPQIRANAPV